MDNATRIFRFRTFDGQGEPQLTLDVTGNMLPAQGHLLPVIGSVEKCMAENQNDWRLVLKIEETIPFEIEFTTLEREIAICRIMRNKLDSLLILVAKGRSDDGTGTFKIVERALSELADPGCLRRVFGWLTEVPPPVAAMIHMGIFRAAACTSWECVSLSVYFDLSKPMSSKISTKSYKLMYFKYLRLLIC